MAGWTASRPARAATSSPRCSTSTPGARRLGEFALGTNTGVDRHTRNVLFDEKMAGTMHCALGQSYPATGGLNASSIHWDMVTDLRHGRVTVDGELFYENGRFVV